MRDQRILYSWKSIEHPYTRVQRSKPSGHGDVFKFRFTCTVLGEGLEQDDCLHIRKTRPCCDLAVLLIMSKTHREQPRVLARTVEGSLRQDSYINAE